VEESMCEVSGVSDYVTGKKQAGYTADFKLIVLLYADKMECKRLHDNSTCIQNVYAHAAIKKGVVSSKQTSHINKANVSVRQTPTDSNMEIEADSFVTGYQWILWAWIAYYTRFDLQELQVMGI
jgi:hypothetical protein